MCSSFFRKIGLKLMVSKKRDSIVFRGYILHQYRYIPINNYRGKMGKTTWKTFYLFAVRCWQCLKKLAGIRINTKDLGLGLEILSLE